MDSSSVNLMTTDRAWILVGVLLRTGHSCTPSQLSDLCQLFGFTCPEIEWLCKLPFSPLSLSICGQVTFSHFLFQLFDSVRYRYARPSSDFPFEDCSFSTPFKQNSSVSLPKLCHLVKSCDSLESQENLEEHRLRSLEPKLIICRDQNDRYLSNKIISVRFTKKRQSQEAVFAVNKKRNVSGSLHVHVSSSKDEVAIFCLNANEIHAKQGVGDTNSYNLILEAERCDKAPGLSEVKQQRNSEFHPERLAMTDSIVDLEVDLDQDLYTEMTHVEMSYPEVCPESTKACIAGIHILPDTIDHMSVHNCSAITEPANVTCMIHKSGSQQSAIADSRQNGNVLDSDGNVRGDQAFTASGIDTLKESLVQSVKERRGLGVVVEHNMIGVSDANNRDNIVCGSRVKSVRSRQKQIEIKKTSGHAQNHAADATCATVTETCSNQLVDDKFPSFDGFIVESVEGSGGYGTVYKVVRKGDGKLLAIKHPFEKTSNKHVQNEINLLQKYGGHSYIPQCIDVIEESGRQCLVLEYIEHEKPEILKKEINISELQTYGFSLFKALEYLHSKGIVHRDVKPGNFLFSRQRKSGWLIDFNLAMVQPKQCSSGGMRYQKQLLEHVDKYKYSHKSHQELEESLNHSTQELWCIAKSSRNSPNHAPIYQRDKSQFSDVSVDSTVRALHKNPTSRTPATIVKSSKQNVQTPPLTERSRQLQNGDGHKVDQVVPRFGRRELWEFLQKSQPVPQPLVSELPSSHRKRVAAPQKRKHQKVHQNVMENNRVLGSNLSFSKAPEVAQLSKARGVQKVRKEGSCAGTKGYRAPEVLLKSPYQNEKIDIWSAGISLFQLLLGKSPFSFSSNLDQSLLDIAQFSGSDAICVLAKEHNRESSLPKEFSVSKLQPSSVKLWCEKNIKRPAMLPSVPSSFYDLIEKCLEIDPKNRITAKEALQHEFFCSCQKPNT